MKVNELAETQSPTQQRCNHIGIRRLAFKDGQQIKCCTNCTVFDKHRREVLCPARGGVRG
jgi:hypothetical protein